MKVSGSIPLLLMGAISAIALAGRGTARADILVVESYVGERPRAAEQLIAPLRAELEKHGLVVDPTVLAMRLDRSIARPGRIDSKLTPTDLLKAFADGFNEWIEGKEMETVAKLDAAVPLALRNSSLLSRDAKLREPLFQGLLTLAIAQQRQNQAAASEATMGELIRSFPDRPIEEQKFGPEARALYQLVRNDLGSLQPGALSIQVSEPATAVFVNEVFQPGLSSSLNIEDLVPGTYRVMVRSLDVSERVRIYSAPVFTGQRTSLVIDWNFDSVLVAENWIGFQFSTTSDLQKERDLAMRFGRAAGATDVVTVNISSQRKGYRITANRYSVATTRELRTCQIDFTSSRRRGLESLGDCIAGKNNSALAAGGGSVAGVIARSVQSSGDVDIALPTASRVNGSISVVPIPEPNATPPATSHGGPSGGVAKWMLGIGGVGTGVVGGLLLYYNSRLGGCADKQISCATLGYVYVGLGTLATVGSAYLFLSEVSPAPAVSSNGARRNGWLAGVAWKW
jgi:hypothetical protein